jgi:hypothetical protein
VAAVGVAGQHNIGLAAVAVLLAVTGVPWPVSRLVVVTALNQR